MDDKPITVEATEILDEGTTPQPPQRPPERFIVRPDRSLSLIRLSKISGVLWFVVWVVSALIPGSQFWFWMPLLFLSFGLGVLALFFAIWEGKPLFTILLVQIVELIRHLRGGPRL